MGQVKSIKHKRSPLVQDGLEIPVEVTVHWEDERVLEFLKRKIEEVSYPLRETDEYQDQSKDILNSLLNEDVLSDSDSEEPIEES